MTYSAKPATSGKSEIAKNGVSERYGFIIGAIVRAFEAYGAALCGHVAIDAAADTWADSRKPVPAETAITNSRTETFTITRRKPVSCVHAVNLG